MRQPPDNRPKASMSEETKLSILLVFLGLGILALIMLVAVLLGRNFRLRPDQAAATAPLPSLAPTIFVPTVDCGSPTLALGLTTFQIQKISLAADGSVSVPAESNGIAYWVEGTDQQYIFMLSSTPENLALLTSLSAGATATWSNCNSMTFTLSDPQPGDFETTYLPDQSTASIAIYIQLDPTGEGFVITGGVTDP